MIRLNVSDLSVDASAPDQPPARTITGLAVPWNVATTDSLGTRVLFEKDSLPENGRAPKLIESHDLSQVRGLVTERVSTDQGMIFTARIASTRAGDDALELLKMGALDAVSVGVEPTKYKFDKDGTMRVQAANWHELSLVAVPAFDDARISSVAASAPEEETEDEVPNYPEPEEDSMSENTEETAPAVIATAPLFAEPRREFRMPTPGEWLAAAAEGGARFAELNAKIRAAAPDVVTSDLDGLMPTPVVSPIYNNFRGIRPVIDSVGVRQMPGGGKVFIRPKVTTHTTIGAVTQGTTIDDGTFVVDDVQVQKGIYGGFVSVSEASLDWSSPEVLGALLDDMARIYANQTDDVAADALAAGATTTGNFTAADLDSPTAWASWISSNAAYILSASNGNLPNTLWASPNVWEYLVGLVDTAGRPLFPIMGPQNAYGELSPASTAGMAFGMRVVVDRNFASNTLILGHSDGFECWEQQKGAVSIEDPSKLARTIAFRGYFSAVMIDSSKFVKAAFV